MRAIYKLFIVVILSFICFNTSYSQHTERSRFNLAQSYERSGSYDNAARIYEDLYREKPFNDNYFYGVVRTYKARNMFASLLPIVENHMKKYKEAPIYILLGEIQWKTGNSADANASWDKAIEAAPDTDTTYARLARTQILLGLFDKAVYTLETGRENLGDQKIFADRLSQLYIATGDYNKGTNEIFNIFESTGDISMAQGRLSALMTNPEAIDYISRALEEKNKRVTSSNYKRIYAWFKRSTGDLEGAFGLIIEMDQLMSADGREILLFANNARNDGQYDISLKAYENILDRGKSNRHFQQAIYGFTRALEQKTFEKDTISDEEYETIIERYRNIIDEFPKSSTAFDCSYRIADIYIKHLKNNEGAVDELTNILENCRQPRMKSKAANTLGEVHILMGNLKEANTVFHDVARLFRRSLPEAYNEALYKIAEIDYYSGEMDSAKAQFDRLIKHTNTDFANDALEKSGLIQENLKQPKALIEFAAAELLEKQRKNEDAIEKYLEVADMATGSPLAELSFKRAGTLEFNRSNIKKSLDIFLTLTDKYPDSIYGDYALIYIGNSYLSLNQKDKAKEAFTDLLVKYPRSIYLQEARNKIRMIRTHI